MSSQPNIVWLTLESIRADHTSFGPAGRETTPNLRSMANEPAGTVLENCFSHGIWTLASSAAILTGTYPSRNGAGVTGRAIPDGIQTVPERLRDAGYTTGCISPNSHLSSGTGLDRGFDRFTWLSKDTLLDAAGWQSMAAYLREFPEHGALSLEPARHSLGFFINRIATEWLAELSSRPSPFFLYLHYGDTHHPYYPPRRYANEYTDGEDFTRTTLFDVAEHHHERLNELISDGLPFDSQEWRALKAAYDATIEYTDALVGSLFETIRAETDETVVVVTADHGELFGEGGMLAHKVVVNDAVSHVPLVVYGADELTDYDGPMVQHIDLVRTLLETVGAETAGIQGLDLRESERDRCYVQRGSDRCRRNLETFTELNPAFDATRYPSETLHAIRTPEFAYHEAGEHSALFRPTAYDEDVSAEHPDVTDELQTHLSSWLDAEGQPLDGSGSEGQFTEEMKSQLEDLGYLV